MFYPRSEFSRLYRSWRHLAHPPLNLTTTRLVISTIQYSFPIVLTLLESSSPGSSVHCEDEVPHLDTSYGVPQSSYSMPVIYPPLTRAEEHVNIVESSHGITKIKKWIQMRTGKSKKDPSLHEPNRVPRKSRQHPDGHSPSQSRARVDTTDKGPSRMAAGQRVPASTLLIDDRMRCV